MNKPRPIIPVNFDNDEELLEYVNEKGNRAEFIRYCIRKEMMEDKKSIGSENDLDIRIENIVRKCLRDFQPTLIEVNTGKEQEDEAVMAAANFFDED